MGINRILQVALAVVGWTVADLARCHADTTVAPAQQASSSKAGQSSSKSKADDGLPMRLHLDDVEIRKALELFSREGSLNILVSSGVTGRVTANLEGLSFDDALNAILKLCNLAAHREKDLIYVYTQDELAQLQQKSGRVSTRVYHLKYLRGIDAEKMITPFLSTESGKVAVTPASEVGIGSQTEQAGGDSLAGSDVLIVQDYESVLQTVDDIIARLDVQPTQVLIEAVITEVKLENSTDLGVNFAVLDGAGRALLSIGSGAELNAIGGFAPSSILAAGGKLPGTTNLGFAPDTHGVKFGFVDDDVTGFMRALEKIGEVQVLASPRIMVLNKQRAELIIGERIGFKTLTVTETHAVEKVEFLNVGTQLRLRPFVGDDGMIRMEIHPERSTGKVEDGLPRTATSEVTTNVIVPDGSTVVIAGLMQDEDELDQSGVPGLSRLHWVGALFRQRFHAKRKRELIVLLTPRIWNPALPENTNCNLASKQGGRRLEVRCQGAAEAVQGETCPQKLTITNVGSQAADEVRVQAVLSQGVNLVTGSPALWSLGTLQPGQSETIDTAFTCSQLGTVHVRFLATGRNDLGGEALQTIRVRLPQPSTESTAAKGGFMRQLTLRRNDRGATEQPTAVGDSGSAAARLLPVAMEEPSAPSASSTDHAAATRQRGTSDLSENRDVAIDLAVSERVSPPQSKPANPPAKTTVRITQARVGGSADLMPSMPQLRSPGTGETTISPITVQESKPVQSPPAQLLPAQLAPARTPRARIVNVQPGTQQPRP